MIKELKELVTVAVKRNPAEGLLFSGGLDSGILAFLCPGIKAITVTFDSFGNDLNYARSLAGFLGIRPHYRRIEVEEAIAAVSPVVRALESFDPAIPNDITVYFGLKTARELGLKTVMTGDGSDEIFAGYQYMQRVKNLDGYLQRMSTTMSFNTQKIAGIFGIEIKQPFLDRDLVDFCRERIPVEQKLRKEEGKFIGKWILRKAFEPDLPADFIWQGKRPLEYGSGTTELREIISARISPEEFQDKSRIYPVKFISRDHFYYYERYRKEIGNIPPAEDGQKACPACGAGMNKKSFHCRICGNNEPGEIVWKEQSDHV
ncbi:MAG: asparagine synthase C-terminal domain-containing protein [bacterium]|nr:asparagine synthase C-terminal domain-containing protein [bacterium]